MELETAKRLVYGKPWHHAFEVSPGVRTRGGYDPSGLWDDLRLPGRLNGLSVADVGASNGFFSFEARRRGARVVAFDSRHRDNSGFGLLQHVAGVDDIEHHHVNVFDINPEQYGIFDIVLALGLLYHVPDPYLGLTRCASICGDRLFIEAYCIDRSLPRKMRREPVVRFLSDPRRFPELGSVNNDPTNFWGFSSEALRRMANDVGFRIEDSYTSRDRVLLLCRREVEESSTRIVESYGVRPRVQVGADPNDPDSWTIF